jgi:RNA polymerase sigma-70 factor (ECF subfamily)
VFDAERFLSRDAAYTAEVIREHHGFVLMWCRAYSTCDDEAEDLAQEVWRTVVAKARGYRGTGSFKSWLHRIAINTCLSAVRSKKSAREALARYQQEDASGRSAARAPDPQRTVERQQLAMSLHRALGALTQGERRAVTLRVLEGRAPQEVAEIMQITPATVRSHVRHGLNHLRRIMEDPDSELSRYRANP